jgi:hypothetical protein
MFVAGIAAVGVTHQAAWLVTSPDAISRGGLREAANRVVSANNLKQIAIAAANYHDSHGVFPTGASFDSSGRGLHGWETMLLPYVEEERLYRSINLKLAWNHPENTSALRTEVRIFLYPEVAERQDADGYALSQYASNIRLLGGNVAISMKDVKDGTVNTILAGEAAGRYKAWGHPTNWREPALGINRTPDGFGHPGFKGPTLCLLTATSSSSITTSVPKSSKR